MKTEHEKALANRHQAWITTPMTTVDYNFFVKKLMKKFDPTNPLKGKLMGAFETLFQMGVLLYPAEVLEIYKDKIKRQW